MGWRGVKPGYDGQIYIHIKSVEVSQGWGGVRLSQDIVDRCMKCGGQSGVGWGGVKPGTDGQVNEVQCQSGVGWGGVKPGYDGQVHEVWRSVRGGVGRG